MKSFSQDGDSTRHCCLGVAHECFVGPLEPDKDSNKNYEDLGVALEMTQKERDGFCKLNDRYRWNFETIADYIEAKYISGTLE